MEYERAGLLGKDALSDDDGPLIAADAGRVRNITLESHDATPKLSGRDLWIRRLEHMTDTEPDDEPEELGEPAPEENGEPLNGRDAYLRRLEEYQP